MKIDILTLFPEMFSSLNESIIGKAKEKNLIEINLINIRNFSKDKHKKVDDTPYGGGCGMALACQPIFDCIKALRTVDSKVIMMTPSGKVYNQGVGKTTIYVYDQTELVDTFTVEVNEVAKKKGCSNTVVVDVLLLTSALSIAFILLKKKH